MEVRKVKTIFLKAGNGLGARIGLSVPQLKRLGITPEDREIYITYDEDKIILTKDKPKEA